MQTLLQPLIVVVLYVAVRCIDIAIGSSKSNTAGGAIRAVVYGILAAIVVIVIGFMLWPR